MFSRDKVIAACRAADEVYYDGSDPHHVIGDEQANAWLDDYLTEHPGVLDKDDFEICEVIAAWGESFALRDMP